MIRHSPPSPRARLTAFVPPRTTPISSTLRGSKVQSVFCVDFVATAFARTESIHSAAASAAVPAAKNAAHPLTLMTDAPS